MAPIAYGWEYGVLDQPPGDAIDGIVTPRLLSMTNPVAAGTPPGDPLSSGALRSTVGYSYGARSQGTTAGLDNAMMRVQSVWWWRGIGQAPARTLARYRYFGAGMLAGMSFFGPGTAAPLPEAAAAVLAQGFADPANAAANPASGMSPSIPGLDRFGQAADLRFVQSSTPQSPTAWRGEYAYDASGNLAVERITQRVVSAGSTPTTGHDRSWVYGYDRLDRLVSAATGTLDSAEPVALATGFASNQNGVNFGKRMSQEWKGLDDLGNWSPSAMLPQGTPGLEETAFSTASGAATSTTKTSHAVDVRNEIRGVTTKVDAAPVQNAAFVYDNAGRMVCDGRFLYEHDFFGRLVQVRRANGAVAGHDDGSYTVSAAALGRLVVHFTYDALGRLIRVQRPENDNTGAQDTQTIHVTDLYYDGVRVIQEVGWTNLAPRLLPVAPGNPGNWYGPRRADELAPTSAPWSGRRAEREYVWAADPGGYVDECLAQVCYTDAHAAGSGQQAGQEVGDDTVPTFLYCITDAHKNLAALADDGGNVVAQYSYTPYGQVRAADYGPVNDPTTPYQEAVKAARGSRLSHQGLRFERLDAPWKGGPGTTTLNSGDASAVFEPTTVAYDGFCHSRNRMYSPRLGRFQSTDPKGLAIPIFDGQARGGMTPWLRMPWPNVDAHVNDGTNVHVAYRLNPLTRTDPSGMGWLDLMQAPVVIGALNYSRYVLARALVNYHTKAIIAAELAAGALDPGRTEALFLRGAGLEVARAISGIRDARTGELLELGANTFRDNVIMWSEAIGKKVDQAFQAHHIIPREMVDRLRRLGVEQLLHNPLFGQMVDKDVHAAIHASGYNEFWRQFLDRIYRDGKRGDDAAKAIIEFISTEVESRFGVHLNT